METSTTEQYLSLEKISVSSTPVDASGKTAIVYCMVWGLIVFALAGLFSIIADLQLAGAGMKILYCAAFCFVGYCHLRSLTYLAPWGELSSVATMLYSLALSAFILLILLLYFFIAGAHSAGFALAGASAFFLPSAIWYCWQQFAGLMPPEHYRPWTLPEPLPGQELSIFLNSVQIRLQLRVNAFDSTERVFMLTVPARKTLGEVFHRFLVDKDSQGIHIQLYDKAQKPFDWIFTQKKELGSRALDPMATLIENDILQNALIIPERVIREEH